MPCHGFEPLNFNSKFEREPCLYSLAAVASGKLGYNIARKNLDGKTQNSHKHTTYHLFLSCLAFVSFGCSGLWLHAAAEFMGIYLGSGRGMLARGWSSITGDCFFT